jgi:hypothetical protein
MFKKSLALLFVIVVVISGCRTESEPAPFIPAKFDVLAIESRHEGLVDSQHPTLVGRWFLSLLSEGELGSRKSFHEFGMQDDSLLRNYDLSIAMNMIESGTLPEWAEPYFLEPPDDYHAMFACAAYYDDGQNPEAWHSTGERWCSVFLAKSWVTATLNEERLSWSEFLLRDPLGLKDH